MQTNKCSPFYWTQKIFLFYKVRTVVPKRDHTNSVHTVLCLLSSMFCVKRWNMFAFFCIEDMLTVSFNSQEERPPILGCPQLFVQYSRSYRPYRRGSVLHPQPEDGPRWGQSGNVQHLSRSAQYAVWPTYTVRISQSSFFLNSQISRNAQRHNKHTVKLILNTNTTINHSIPLNYVFRWQNQIFNM